MGRGGTSGPASNDPPSIQGSFYRRFVIHWKHFYRLCWNECKLLCIFVSIMNVKLSEIYCLHDDYERVFMNVENKLVYI